MKDIILINGYRVGRPVLPAGIGYIAQAIEDAGFEYDVCDVNLLTHNQIVQKVNESKPKYVGCGTMTHDVEKNYELLLSIRETIPNIIIILGGPHAIAAQNAVFEECFSVDIVIQGEGEEAIVKLLRNESLDTIPGILTRDVQDKTIVHKLLDIDKVAFPKYHKFDLAKYGNSITIASSRGCVYKCIFCGAPKFLGKKWRAFKLERMIEEFEYWYGKGFREFYFSDSLFVLNKKRVIDFCAYIVKNGYNDVVFTADGVRADHLTLEILQCMKNANFTSINIGVESVNDETLKFFDKGETFSQIDSAISMADSLGFNITVYLIIGAPTESYRDAIRSIDYPLKYKHIINSVVSKLLPIKGTKYYSYAIENKLVKDESIYYPELEVYGCNKRVESSNLVEEIWGAVYPEINKISNIISVRRYVYKVISIMGFRNINVTYLNIMTYICLNPLIFALLNTLKFLIKKIKNWNTIFFDIILKIRNPKLRGAFSITSHLTIKERVTLFKLVVPTKKIIAEIGSYIGASTCCFGAAVKASGTGKIICIDTWNNDHMSEGNRDTWKEFQDNTSKYKNLIVPIRGYSTYVIQNVLDVTTDLDVLFIDGDHSYKGVKADWEAYKSFLKNGSVVIFHDYGWAEGVKRVVHEDVMPLVCSHDHLPNMWWGQIGSVS